MNALFLIDRDRDLSAKLSAAILVAKLKMCIEKLDVDFQQISKNAVADNSIGRRSETTVRYAGPDKNESRQKFLPFRAEWSQ